jgi:hypothetical protein
VLTLAGAGGVGVVRRGAEEAIRQHVVVRGNRLAQVKHVVLATEMTVWELLDVLVDTAVQLIHLSRTRV